MFSCNFDVSDFAVVTWSGREYWTPYYLFVQCSIYQCVTWLVYTALMIHGRTIKSWINRKVTFSSFVLFQGARELKFSVAFLSRPVENVLKFPNVVTPNHKLFSLLLHN